MKKTLLGTTAIVGASMLMMGGAQASDPPQLKFSGFMRFEAKFVDQDYTAGRTGGHFESDDAEFVLNADATADNGLKYGVKIEVDTDNTTASIDEMRIRFSGDWGILDLGDDDGAEDTMAYGAENILTAGSGFDGGPSSAFNFIGVGQFTPDLGEQGGDSNDASKITYYTPRIQGFQLGVSYTPDTGNFHTSTVNATSNADGRNHVGIGLNYVETFGDVGVNLSGIYGFADVEKQAAGVVCTAAELEDYSGYMIGGGLSYMGVKVAAGYGDAGDGGIAKNSQADNGKWWDVGVSYATGPYTLAVAYLAGEEDNVAGTADDETDFLTLQGQYNVAPGLDVYAELDWIEVDSPTNTTRGGSGGAVVTDNEGWLLLLGTKVTF
jgi:hypothetical protein